MGDSGLLLSLGSPMVLGFTVNCYHAGRETRREIYDCAFIGALMRVLFYVLFISCSCSFGDTFLPRFMLGYGFVAKDGYMVAIERMAGFSRSTTC